MRIDIDFIKNIESFMFLFWLVQTKLIKPKQVCIVFLESLSLIMWCICVKI